MMRDVDTISRYFDTLVSQCICNAVVFPSQDRDMYLLAYSALFKDNTAAPKFLLTNHSVTPNLLVPITIFIESQTPPYQAGVVVDEFQATLCVSSVPVLAYSGIPTCASPSSIDVSIMVIHNTDINIVIGTFVDTICFDDIYGSLLVSYRFGNYFSVS